MEFHVEILLNLLIKAVRSPGLSKEAQRHSLTETVELQTAASTSIHDGGVVNDSHGNIALLRTNPEVGVSGCSIYHSLFFCLPKDVSNDEEGSVTNSSTVQNHFCIRLNQITISDNHLLSEEFLLSFNTHRHSIPVSQVQHRELRCNSRGILSRSS